MKKLMTVAAAVMLAAVTHAAAVGWSILGASAYANGAYNVFVVGMNGVTDVNQIVAMVADGSDVSSFAFYDGGTVTSSGTASVTVATSGKSITYSGSGTDVYKAFAVLWTADNSAASYTDIRSISMANDTTGKTFAFGNQATTLANNQFTIGAVPEPTSGLLLLLGMAGLALKRKVA
ncbi:MAG: PEP-CTERM sorting domain-containing protein [Kiritimatiellia bacterium]